MKRKKQPKRGVLKRKMDNDCIFSFSGVIRSPDFFFNDKSVLLL